MGTFLSMQGVAPVIWKTIREFLLTTPARTVKIDVWNAGQDFEVTLSFMRMGPLDAYARLGLPTVVGDTGFSLTDTPFRELSVSPSGKKCTVQMRFTSRGSWRSIADGFSAYLCLSTRMRLEKAWSRRVIRELEGKIEQQQLALEKLKGKVRS